MMGFGGVVQSFEHCPQGFEHSPKPSAKRVTAEAAEVERERERTGLSGPPRPLRFSFEPD